MTRPWFQISIPTLWQSVLIAFAILASPWSSVCADADRAAATGGLFIDVPTPKSTVATRPTVMRRRVVTVDIATMRAQKGLGAKLALNLFPDAEYEGVVERIVQRSDEDFTLTGTLAGQQLSSFALAVKDGVAVMNIRTSDRGMFHLRHLNTGVYEVRQIDEAQYPPCATGKNHEVAAPAAAAGVKGGRSTAKSDNGAIVDVMVVYTPASRIAAGGASAIQALINLAVEEANTAYDESAITPRLRLVHQQEVSYTESVSFDTDLSRLTNPGDGYVDAIHALRNQHGADMVCMLVDNSEYCGLAWLMTTLSPGFESSAFSVVYWDCATGYYTFAHELAHNMGCTHDRENAPGSGLYGYSYGWRFMTAGNVTNRTIMAYAPGVRAQRFSNPNVLYDGVPTGVPAGQPNAANNALTINNSAYTVANWRPAVVTDTNCTFAVAPGTTNLSASAGSNSVSVIASSNNCVWTVTSLSGFITVTDGTPGMGNGAVDYFVAANNSSIARTGRLMVAEQIITVVQAGVTTVALAEALDMTNFIWVVGGSVPWAGQIAMTHDGADAARSGIISHSQQSYVETSVTGPTTLQFWWKVSSETNYDYLRVVLDGATSQSISGEVDWQLRSLSVTSGTHTVRWVYAKDGSLSKGQDAAWLDQVKVLPFCFVPQSIVRLNGDVLQMELHGPASATAIVEASTDLANWAPVATNLFGPSCNWIYSNSTSGLPQQFYRAFIR